MRNAPRCTLIGTSGELVGVTVVVGPDGLMVGRGLEAALRLPGEDVSRYHARIECTRGGAIVLSDLDSSAGTFVNGRRVEKPNTLRDGDRIQFGPRTEFVVRCDASDARDTAEIEQPAHARGVVDLLALRNQARILIGDGSFASAKPILLDVLEGLEANGAWVAQEDVAEILVELARCEVGLGDAGSAIERCKRAIALLMGTSSGARAMVRAKFVLGQALLPTAPEDARRVVQEAAASLEPGSALRQGLESWLAVADPAPDA